MGLLLQLALFIILSFCAFLTINPRTRRLLPHNLAAAASHAPPHAMANSSSATAPAAGSTKLEQVKSLGRDLLSARTHLNHAPVLLKLLSPSTRLDLAVEALISLQSFFVPLTPSVFSSSAATAAAAAGDACGDPELVFGSWLRHRFDELLAALVELSVSSQSADAIRVSF
jgi:U3 small nucleolar RNA-associated protein 19